MSAAPDQYTPPAWTRPLAWFTNPHGLNDDRRLREAVQGKTVMVTGASFGIGEATAKRLASMGAKVLLVARTQDKLEVVAQAIRAAGGEAVVYAVDLSKPHDAAALAERVLKEHGHLDILLNNAGRSIRRSIHESYDRFHDFERTMAINYLGPVQLVLGFIPSMRARKQGQIINISTWGVKIPPGANWAAYQASKAAFDVWLRSVSTEIKPDGIDVTSIYPAVVYTRMSAPTKALHHMPGMSVEEAAHVIERAIVERPDDISPPWLWGMQVASVTLSKPVRWLMQKTYRPAFTKR
ncbi:short-subunit dehydrogenase [Fluviicoccus keumensis]|uniref:Short-subunit dehydrogenase n=1 Tax=Fluviicoccus keumensis TaxID=1435465 RepID=A0A4Q7YN65_9GAMM|nr:SDR family NAD(P)-dependent oxidoreductase [Fluviicoccus keumensis]RZU38251.1 short-subunit dehydrogenase [Fluviicoccus keumensis]